MLEQFLESLTHLSLLTSIAITFALLLFVPPLCARVKLPGVVGLLLVGVVVGPSGLHMTREGMPVLTFFGEIGKLLIMFFAGLEIDLAQAKRTGGHSLLFGLLTCLLPLAAGTTVGLIFGYSWVSSLLIGSLMASHTLIGYPIVQRLGLGGKEVVAVTVGATVLTDVSSLMVLAVSVPIHTSGFSPGSFTMQVIELAIYVPVVILGGSEPDSVSKAQIICGREAHHPADVDSGVRSKQKSGGIHHEQIRIPEPGGLNGPEDVRDVSPGDAT